MEIEILIDKIKGRYPYELIENQLLVCGDCLNVMKDMEDNSVDSIVCDPPYGLSFMGKKWDYDVPKVEIWKECLRVLKAGGHLLAFAGTRTQHRMACNIEDAGFEIRDMIAWIYGTGFPKSLNIGKAIDKMQGNKREVVGEIRAGSTAMGQNSNWNKHNNKTRMDLTKGSSIYEGWGSALKPALEPITLARKPLSEKTVASNVLKHGTGGINIDGCRVEGKAKKWSKPKGGIWNPSKDNKAKLEDNTKGRFPANIIHDGSEEVLKIFPNSNSSNRNNLVKRKDDSINYGGKSGKISTRIEFGDKGSASRFFYCAKASKQDRSEGLEEFKEKQTVGGGGGIGNYLKDVNSASGKFGSEKAPSKNTHPTVKPTKLMQYLVRLVTPPKGIVLDPFIGSGSTGKACVKEKFGFIGIDLDKEYFNIACARIKEETKQNTFNF